MRLLEIFSIIWESIIGRGFEYFPRESNRLIPALNILQRINDQLKDIDLSGVQSEEFLKRARESLDEVKSQTEYQDEKTSRLLTIVAFLTAAAGAIFSKILDVYPLHLALRLHTLQAIMVDLLYVLFALFLLLVAMGALISFQAIRTRFIWKKDQSKEKKEEMADNVGSFLFFQSIVMTKPEVWADAFLDKTNKAKPNLLLSSEYYKNYIVESYLIAAKFANKFRYLDTAQSLLLWSIKLLILWIFSLAVVAIYVPTSNDFKSAIKEKSDLGQNGPPVINIPQISLYEIPVSGVIAICTPPNKVKKHMPNIKQRVPIQPGEK